MRAALLVTAVALSAIGCGHAIPGHGGYTTSEPWSRAEQLVLDRNHEADADGEVSYPGRSRARWFAVDLPAGGDLSVRMDFEPTSDKSVTAGVGVEVLDEAFNVFAEASEDEEDGERRKTRTAKELPKGTAYIHVFAIGKLDAADFTLRVKFEPGAGGDPRAILAKTVKPLPVLAAVPAADDAPPPKKAPPAKGRGDGDKPEKAAADPAKGGKLTGRIVEFGAEGGGVRIIVNRGQSHGVEEGWSGFIVSSATKKALQGGSFTVKSVGSSECEATVGLTADDIQANRTVVLKPAN